MDLSILVFLVDDDVDIREVLETALKEGGFAVALASTGEEAISMLDAEGKKYRALITDINMGLEVTGWDVAKHARELLEALPVVYMTGGNGVHEWASKGVPNSVLLIKPFAPAQLITAVSQLLNQGNTPGV
jgi:DNA-binding NtrC family response regulator